MMTNWLAAAFSISVLVIAGAGAFTIMGYEEHANTQGWTVGLWFIGKTGDVLRLLSFLVLITALWKAWYLFNWWVALLIAVGTFVLAFLASQLLGPRVQPVALVAMVLGGIGAALLGAEIVSR